jgi:hypothetical protein
MRPACALAAAAAAFGLAACGGGGRGGKDEHAARATVSRYFAALGAGRGAAACAEMSTPSRERVAEFAGVFRLPSRSCGSVVDRIYRAPQAQPGLQRLGRPAITSVEVTGDRARVTVDGTDRPVELVHSRGAWRIEFTPQVEADRLPGAAKEHEEGTRG